MRTTLVPLCLLIAACTGPTETDDTSTPCETDCDTGSEDTGEEETLESLTQHGYMLHFAWDDTAGATRSYTIDGAEVTSTLELHLISPNAVFDAENPAYSCVLTYDINGLSDADYDGRDDYPLALEFTLEPAKIVSDTCTERVGTVFEPTSFVDTPTADVSNWMVRIAFGGELDATVKTMIDDDPAEELDSTNAFGGQLRLPYQDGDSDEPSVSEIPVWGYAVDSSFVVTQDGDGNKTAITTDAVESTDALVDGQYTVYAQFNWFFDSAL